MRVIECVPNVSEGRDQAIIRQIVLAVKVAHGVELLDWSADADHNRTVLTYVGEPEAVLTATEALCKAAFRLIDMQKHHGAHPRLGAVDVIPFVPLRGVTNEEAVSLARRLGEWIGEQGVPVYYYQEAATRPERESLPDVRRGEYEGLAARICSPEGEPDAGPAVFNARSGASIVGVRFPLIAFNVNLATDDLAIAKRIAEAVRFSGGGYRYVRAMGVALEGKGQVQVSTDILQYEKTPIHRVLETIRSEAASHGVAVAGCELVGLAPMAAFEEVIRHYLQLHDFSVDQVIESRLLKK
ncbi:MAG: glutamate formimidoyltransferase [Actinobacteria bacterium RBG_16_64_13]|nr:MAG: glutamate formimidoyltransferase [Actinobacteria bacterium RBG_16_64_13]